MCSPGADVGMPGDSVFGISNGTLPETWEAWLRTRSPLLPLLLVVAMLLHPILTTECFRCTEGLCESLQNPLSRVRNSTDRTRLESPGYGGTIRR